MISNCSANMTFSGSMKDASVLVADPVFDDLVAEVVTRLDTPPHTVRVGPDYERLVEEGEPTAVRPADERGLLSINYTSGTTGNPKGVMYHHRGAYLQALAMVGHTGLTDIAMWADPQRALSVAVISSGKPGGHPEAKRYPALLDRINAEIPRV